PRGPEHDLPGARRYRRHRGHRPANALDADERGHHRGVRASGPDSAAPVPLSDRDPDDPRLAPPRAGLDVLDVAERGPAPAGPGPPERRRGDRGTTGHRAGPRRPRRSGRPEAPPQLLVPVLRPGTRG